MSLETAWILCAKDWRLFVRDRTALLLSLALPIFLASIFAAAMGGFGDAGMGRVELLVEDLDHSPRSIALVGRLAADEGLSVAEVQGARKRVADGKAPGALVIPQGWGAALGTEQRLELMAYRDPGATVEQQLLAVGLVRALLASGDEELTRAMVTRGMSELGFSFEQYPGLRGYFDTAWDSIADWMRSRPVRAEGGPEAGPAAEDPAAELGRVLPRLLGVRLEDVAGGEDASQKSAMQSHAISGITVMMLLFGLVAVGGTILEEHDQGTLERLRLAPEEGGTILLGKFLFSATVGCAQVTILLAYGGTVFDVPVMRAPLALAVLSLALVVAATGLGLALAVHARTRKQLEGFSTLVILVMSALGGSWFPLVVTPEWYRKLGHFTLNAWAMDGYQGVFWYGKGLAGIWLEVLVLFAIGAVTSLLAARMWRRRFLAVD